MKKSITTNTFQEGMIMDFNPLVIPEGSLTTCLNGTIITMNGNEYCLLNDMGNGRVETAYLPEGYIPLGTAELGGIIYIVSYNPLINKCLIGSFPSPERNITTDELGESDKELNISQFYKNNNNNKEGFIITPIIRIDLTSKELNPGDKFLIACNSLTNDISAVNNINFNPDKNPRYLKFNVVAIDNNGKTLNLNNSLVWNNGYYMKNGELSKVEGSPDLDEYRDFIKANYSVFNSQTSGKLAILALLECINTFSVSWDALQEEDSWNFYFLYNWTYNNVIDYNKINLYKVKIDVKNSLGSTIASLNITLTDYPTSGGIDILSNPNTIFYNPTYISNVADSIVNNIPQVGVGERKNDGTDNYYLLKVPTKLNKDLGIVTIDIYPGMPFGYLEYLKQSFTINLKLLGSGEINLTEYRYYYNPNGTITLNWGLEAYPLKNEKINDVIFNFYLITLDNIDKISDIDTDEFDRLKRHQPIADLGTSIKYTTSKKTSYSGNFTETIQLAENTVYIVEIKVDYSNKPVYFYRILYNSNLFNLFYFELTDFKEIELQSALRIEFELKSIVAESISDVYVKDPEIKSYLDADNIEEKIDYTIKHDYNISLKTLIIPKVNDVFKAEILKLSNIQVNKEDLIHLATTNKMFYNNETIPMLLDLESPEYYINNDGLKFTYKDKDTIDILHQFGIKTPLIVEYKNIIESPIPYKLEHFNILPLWLLVDGASKNIYLYVSDIYQVRGDVPEENRDHFGDDKDGRKIMPLKLYSNVNLTLKEYLKNYDMLAIRFRTYHTAKVGNEGLVTTFGYGEPKGDAKRRTFEKFLEWNYSDNNHLNNGVNLILYAVLDGKEDVLLFSFGVPATGSSPTKSQWYGVSLKTDHTNRSWSMLKYPIALRHDQVTDELLRKPFDRYYKVADHVGAVTINSWSVIHYYNNYIWTIPINIKLNVDYSLKINKNVNVKQNMTVKNLKYIIEDKVTNIIINLTYLENFNKIINLILSPTTENSTPTLINDKLLHISNISPGLVYNDSGKPNFYLYTDDGTGNGTETDNKLKIIDELLRLELGNLNNIKTVLVMGREEELNLTVKNILYI